MKNSPEGATPFWRRLQEALLAQARIQLISDHYVLAAWLTPQSIVLDLGANVGDFSREISSSFGCRCVAVEPAPANFLKIPATPLITKLPFAAGAQEGTGRLFLAEHIQGHSLFAAGHDEAGDALSVPIEILAYRSLLAKAAVTRVDLLKIDIEGAEWGFIEEISDEDLRQIPQITVEFHDFVPALRNQCRTPQVCQRLRELGFVCIQDTRRGTYNTLFVNAQHVEITWRVRILLGGILLCGKIRQWVNGARRRLGRPPIS